MVLSIPVVLGRQGSETLSTECTCCKSWCICRQDTTESCVRVVQLRSVLTLIETKSLGIKASGFLCGKYTQFGKRWHVGLGQHGSAGVHGFASLGRFKNQRNLVSQRHSLPMHRSPRHCTCACKVDQPPYSPSSTPAAKRIGQGTAHCPPMPKCRTILYTT